MKVQSPVTVDELKELKLKGNMRGYNKKLSRYHKWLERGRIRDRIKHQNSMHEEWRKKNMITAK